MEVLPSDASALAMLPTVLLSISGTNRNVGETSNCDPLAYYMCKIVSCEFGELHAPVMTTLRMDVLKKEPELNEVIRAR